MARRSSSGARRMGVAVVPAAAAMLTAVPAAAAEGSFFALSNTDFIVTLAFLAFAAILIYYRVPRILAGMLDRRAEKIRAELDEARALREEAQTLLASFERKHKEVEEQAERIVATAKREAEAEMEQNKREVEESVRRRLEAAEDRIASAEAAAVRSVRNRAVNVAVEAAREVLQAQLTAEDRADMANRSIETVREKLH